MLPGGRAREAPGMWSAAIPDDGPGEEFLRRASAPGNEIPVALPQNLLLARTDDVAVALSALHVYTTGLAFQLVARLRPSARTGRRTLDELFWRHGPHADRFLFGVEFADGRRASTLSHGSPDGLVFHPGGGSGGQASVEQTWWLHPLPPEGPVRFVVRCDELAIPETSVELDGTAVRRAAGGVVSLWPWEPPPEHGPPEPPEPPDVPADSWFAHR